jgi:phosphopantetheinyl transferase (holo-ACP synthase)
MSLEQKAKEIVAGFLGCDPLEITGATAIGAAISSSIQQHQLHAALQRAGVNMAGIDRITTFSDIFPGQSESPYRPAPREDATAPLPSHALSCGVDIEQYDRLPETADWWNDPFYIDNFAPAEVAYCLLQVDPKLHFLGLFAAKEAILKADNSFCGLPFNQIEIRHDDLGKPMFAPLALSISHSPQYAVAMAIRGGEPLPASQSHAVAPEPVATPRAPVKKANRLLIFIGITGALFVGLAYLVMRHLS